MRFSLVLAALLCFTAWMSMVHATHGPVSSCCLHWSDTIVRFDNIQDYTNQSDSICPIRAVVFQTKKGKRICSDPNSEWAKNTILRVDKKKEKKALQENGRNKEASTSDITPAASMTSKNTPQKKSKNGGRRQRSKYRRGKKGLRKCM